LPAGEDGLPAAVLADGAAAPAACGAPEAVLAEDEAGACPGVALPGAGAAASPEGAAAWSVAGVSAGAEFSGAGAADWD
jgi:hypothetical protein